MPTLPVRRPAASFLGHALTRSTSTDYPPVPLDGDEPASPPTTIIGMKRLLLEPHKRKPFNRSIVRLESVRLCEPDAGFEILRSQIRAWSAEYGFEAWSSGCARAVLPLIAARTAH